MVWMVEYGAGDVLVVVTSEVVAGYVEEVLGCWSLKWVVDERTAVMEQCVEIYTQKGECVLFTR